tara:strand:- start:404 stop:790 length:387 start_codon:yes stop_codon:yes gene_type:complete
MKTLGNLLWLLFGGFFMALEYLIVSAILLVSIIGIPFGIQTLKLAGLALWPFGREAVFKENTSSSVSTLMNIIWIVLGGIWISLSHIIFGILLGVTIIGIPFAKQHFKLAILALTPFGREIKKKDKYS